MYAETCRKEQKCEWLTSSSSMLSSSSCGEHHAFLLVSIDDNEGREVRKKIFLLMQNVSQ